MLETPFRVTRTEQVQNTPYSQKLDKFNFLKHFTPFLKFYIKSLYFVPNDTKKGCRLYLILEGIMKVILKGSS